MNALFGSEAKRSWCFCSLGEGMQPGLRTGGQIDARVSHDAGADVVDRPVQYLGFLVEAVGILKMLLITRDLLRSTFDRLAHALQGICAVAQGEVRFKIEAVYVGVHARCSCFGVSP